MNERGVSVFELLVVLGLMALLIILLAPGFKAFFSRLEIQKGVQMTVLAINTARFKAASLNRRVKLVVDKHCLVLNTYGEKKWVPFDRISAGNSIDLRANKMPVFSPTGTVAPTCTFIISNPNFNYKVTLSILGRIKTQRNE